MQTPKKSLFMGLALAVSTIALGAATVSGRRNERQLAEQVAALATSVERLRSEPAPARVVEYRTTREVVSVDRAPAEHKEPVANKEAERPSQLPFDLEDFRAYRSGRGPHPVERLFEQEGAARGGEPAVRLRALETAMSSALEGIDADVHDVECRASACRIDVTFASMAASNSFAARIFRPSAEGQMAIDHGGAIAPVQEAIGDRHHSVFYMLRKVEEGVDSARGAHHPLTAATLQSLTGVGASRPP